MKKIILLMILGLVASSVFATDWTKYGTYENDEAGVYDVYFDFDATEPFDLEKESIKYTLHLLERFKKVGVKSYNIDSNQWCAKGAEHNCYATLEVYKDYWYEYHVNSDGTVTEYYYSGRE